MTQRIWWLSYWLAWVLWALIAVVVIAGGDAMGADCYTPLTCLYGNDLGRSMEYERQQRQLQDLQSRRRELELQQQERETQRELDQLRRRDNDVLSPRRW